MRKSMLALALALAAGSAGAAYKCVDEKGITQIGDVPPAGCANVPMYEISTTGSVLRRIDPTPTPEQLKVRQASEAKRKEEERAAAEQKRKDDALLSTYSSDKEIDIARDRNIAPITMRIASARDRLAEIDKREEQLADELEFYAAGKAKKDAKAKDAKSHPAPPALLAEQDHLRKEKVTLAASIAASEKEMQDVKARYDEDKKRWLFVKGGGRLPADNAPAPPAVTQTSGAAKAR